MKIIIKKRRKKICQPLAGPDPPLPPAIFSENRRISFFFRFTLHRQYSLCSLFHFVAFSYISVWPHKQGAAEYEEEAKSRITVHRATKVNSLDFGFPRVATSLVHLGGDHFAPPSPGGDRGSAATREQLTSVFTLDAHSLSSVCGPPEKIWLCWSAQ